MQFLVTLDPSFDTLPVDEVQKHLERAVRAGMGNSATVAAPTLHSADGSFQCAPEHAVEVAYMISNFESAYEQDRDPLIEELFRGYLAGNESVEGVNGILFREWPEAFPGHKS